MAPMLATPFRGVKRAAPPIEQIRADGQLEIIAKRFEQ
jgi:hypothetical protein